MKKVALLLGPVGITVLLSATLVEEGVPQETRGYFSNKFKVNVTFKDTGKRTSFSFSGSHKDYQDGKVTMEDEKELYWAFQCFVSDALAAVDTFEDFCSEFGYDTDSRKAEKIYKACGKSLEKLQKVFTDDQLYEIANFLNELENNNWQTPEPEAETV